LNIAPDKDGRPDFEAPIGTGAYVLELFEPGVRALLRLNPNRWNQEVGFVETAELLAVNDTQSRQSALISNSLDAINRLDLKTAARLAQNQNVRVVSVPGRLHVSMPMRVNVEPFSNNDVRTALKLAVNREEWRKKLLFGHAELGNDHPIGSAYPYHASDIPQREYDPDKAKFLLKRAGYSSIKISLSAADAGWLGAVDAATIYKENAAKAGIDIDIVRESNDDYWNSVWNHKAFIVMYWGPRASEDMILSANYVSEAPLNDNGWKSERLDKLLFAARAELDETKRRELYREIQLLIRDDGATIIPLFPEMVQAVSAKVGIDKNISGNWEMDGGKFVERWWLTA
jgi:peptide/nickel transport system substrate-binding protein